MGVPRQTWSIVVLCYNEAVTIEKVILGVEETLKQIAVDYEIVAVNDGSKDESPKILAGIAAQNPRVKFINQVVNAGIGPSLHNGYSNAVMENVCFVPGDGQFDLNELIPYMNPDDNEIVSFYRVENTSYSLFRNLLSLINKMVNQLFIGIDMRDVNWVKIYKNKGLKQLDLRIKSSLVESEICAKMLLEGYRITEVQSKYLDREGGKSKGASFKIIFQAAKEVIKLIFELQRYKRQK